MSLINIKDPLDSEAK